MQFVTIVGKNLCEKMSDKMIFSLSAALHRCYSAQTVWDHRKFVVSFSTKMSNIFQRNDSLFQYLTLIVLLPKYEKISVFQHAAALWSKYTCSVNSAEQTVNNNNRQSPLAEVFYKICPVQTYLHIFATEVWSVQCAYLFNLCDKNF